MSIVQSMQMITVFNRIQNILQYFIIICRFMEIWTYVLNLKNLNFSLRYVTLFMYSSLMLITTIIIAIDAVVEK